LLFDEPVELGKVGFAQEFEILRLSIVGRDVDVVADDRID